MEFIVSTFSFLIGYILPFLVVLSIVVFVHEMGHYLVGRWCGIHATAFSIGFGPEIAGFTAKDGTRWKISAIPLGGYVKFLGDLNASSQPDQAGLNQLSQSDRARSFPAAALWKRAATVLAGPVANFILAILIFAITLTIYGRQVADPVISKVNPESAAEAAGLLPGDLFVSIDGIEITTFDDVRRYITSRPDTQVSIEIKRDGELIDVELTPMRTEIEDRFGNKMEVGLMGVVTDQTTGNFRTVNYSFPEAIVQGSLDSLYIVTRTFDYIGNIIVGREKPDQLGGPIRVAQVSGQMATLGVAALIQLAAVLSVSIGLINLMPVPMLDGGHLMFYLFEAVRGKPLDAKMQEWAFRVGLMLVLALMMFATWNDLNSVLS